MEMSALLILYERIGFVHEPSISFSASPPRRREP